MTVMPPKDRSLRTGAALAGAGLIGADAVADADAVARRYAVAVTPHLAGLMIAGAADDPIGRQFLPHPAELETADEERADPIADAPFTPVKGIVHRHADRVLLMPTPLCPAYCRFCFRRESVGAAEGVLTTAELDTALLYIAATEGIREVILSGGDPLTLSDRRLADIVRRLDAIHHVEVIRIHTRVPIVAPSRITAELAATLDVETPVYVVVHCNHARELAAAARAACRRLVRAGIPLLGQTVLLKGVNDDAGTLAELMRALVRNRIKPYYLHHADLAPGTAHFRTTLEAGRALVRELRQAVSGLCQPTYVLDIPGGHGKVPVGPDHLLPGTPQTVTDQHGTPHLYPPPPPAVALPPPGQADRFRGAQSTPERLRGRQS